VEINNTYGESHLYILDQPAKPVGNYLAHYEILKEFFVSPFNDLKGDYQFLCSPIDNKIDISINLIKKGEQVITTRLWGKGISLDSSNLLKTLVKYPFAASLAMPRITWEALNLKYRKGLKAYLKPKPNHPMTIRTSSPFFKQLLHKHYSSKRHKN